MRAGNHADEADQQRISLEDGAHRPADMASLLLSLVGIVSVVPDAFEHLAAGVANRAKRAARRTRSLVDPCLALVPPAARSMQQQPAQRRQMWRDYGRAAMPHRRRSARAGAGWHGSPLATFIPTTPFLLMESVIMSMPFPRS